MHETLRYYSHKEIIDLPFPPDKGTVLKGPWYLMVPDLYLGYFLNDDGSVKDIYKDLELKYRNNHIFVFFSGKDLSLVK